MAEDVGRCFLDAALRDTEHALGGMRASLINVSAPTTAAEAQESMRYVASVKTLMDYLYDTIEIANLKFLDDAITVDDLCGVFRIMLDIHDVVPEVVLFGRR